MSKCQVYEVNYTERSIILCRIIIIERKYTCGSKPGNLYHVAYKIINEQCFVADRDIQLFLK